MPIIDLTDLLSPADAAAVRASLAKRGASPTTKRRAASPTTTPVIQTLTKTEHFVPRGLYTGLRHHVAIRQVSFLPVSRCSCGATHIVASQDAQLFDFIVDSPFTAHYEPSTRRDDSLPFTLETRTSLVSICASCAASPHIDPTLLRMFPPAPSLDLQLAFDFTRWTNPPAASSLALRANSDLTIIKGLQHVKLFRRSRRPFLGYPSAPSFDISDAIGPSSPLPASPTSPNPHST
jgi:hypothetical protein